jgi:hypothetical protein
LVNEEKFEMTEYEEQSLILLKQIASDIRGLRTAFHDWEKNKRKEVEGGEAAAGRSGSDTSKLPSEGRRERDRPVPCTRGGGTRRRQTALSW